MDRERTIPRLAARVLLLDHDDRVLLFRSTVPDTGSVFWIAPGGGIEPGETARPAAAREPFEETGAHFVPPCRRAAETTRRSCVT